jgi:hypothetical protein
LFSAIVGFTAMVNPLANYYTKFYFGVGATLWATTFSFAVLFIPKVYIFYKQWTLRSKSDRKKRNNSGSTNNTRIEDNINDGEITVHSFLKYNYDYNNNLSKSIENYDFVEASVPYTKSLLLEQTASDSNIITRTYSSGVIDSTNNSVSASESNYQYNNTNVYVEVQEVRTRICWYNAL